MMGVRYTICHWAINRTDPQNLLSTTLDVPLHHPPFYNQQLGNPNFLRFSLFLQPPTRQRSEPPHPYSKGA